MRTMKTLIYKRNLLLRYAKIVEIYKAHKEEDVPSTRVLKKHIFPIYPISYRTLMTILSTPVNKELKEIDQNIEELKRSVN